MTMEFYRPECTLASPTSLQLCINHLLGACVDSNLSAYSASGLDLYIDLGIKFSPWPSPSPASPSPATREPDSSRHDHLNLAFQNSRTGIFSDSFLPPEQQLRLQPEFDHSACHTAAGEEEPEENAQSVRDAVKTSNGSNQFHEDAERQEEERESTALTNCSDRGLESEEYPICTKPLLTCPANVLSQIECFDMADVSAACYLLELSSYSGSVDSSGRDQSSETYDDAPSRRHYSDFFETASDYEELTQLVDRLNRLQAALPGGVRPPTWMGGAKFRRTMTHDASPFRKRRVRANLIKQTDVVGQIHFDDWDFEVEVLERPPSKRRNRRVDIIYERSIQM